MPQTQKKASSWQILDTMIHVLVYADDAVVLEDGSTEGVQNVTTRVNDISKGSQEDADMFLNADKTVVIHIRNQDKVTPLTQEEEQGVCKFICPYLNCGFKFRTKSDMKIHAVSCEWSNEFEVNHITDSNSQTISSKMEEPCSYI